MRASEYRELAEQLRADGLTTGQLIERWVTERGLNPREAARVSHGWTQQQAADEWNTLWPDPEHPCTRKHVSQLGDDPATEPRHPEPAGAGVPVRRGRAARRGGLQPPR